MVYNIFVGEAKGLSAIEALERAGINSEKIAIYDTDGEWQNGYMIHYEKDGTVKFKKAEPVSYEICSLSGMIVSGVCIFISFAGVRTEN